ncbi:hypothetical protein HK405_010411 [Cladochytrium tenue]|nr:hypothetical protein HK405_010411 [Cladochytrium tenue]
MLDDDDRHELMRIFADAANVAEDAEEAGGHSGLVSAPVAATALFSLAMLSPGSLPLQAIYGSDADLEIPESLSGTDPTSRVAAAYTCILQWANLSRAGGSPIILSGSEAFPISADDENIDTGSPLRPERFTWSRGGATAAAAAITHRAGRFVALSHVWGDVRTMRSRALGDVLCSSPEKWRAVTAIARAVPADLWLDVVSIDQNSDDDKCAQVTVMHRIYADAGTVVVLLGDADFAALATMVALIRIVVVMVADVVADGDVTAFPQSLPVETIARLATDRLLAKCITALNKAVEAWRATDYNRRVWTLQELLLAKRLVATHDGEAYIDLKSVEEQAFALGSATTAWASFTNMDMLSVFMAAEDSIAQFILLGDTLLTAIRPDVQRLEDLAFWLRSAHRVCSIEKDVLFGVYRLILPDFDLDYSIPAPEAAARIHFELVRRGLGKMLPQHENLGSDNEPSNMTLGRLRQTTTDPLDWQNTWLAWLIGPYGTIDADINPPQPPKMRLSEDLTRAIITVPDPMVWPQRLGDVSAVPGARCCACRPRQLSLRIVERLDPDAPPDTTRVRTDIEHLRISVLCDRHRLKATAVFPKLAGTPIPSGLRLLTLNQHLYLLAFPDDGAPARVVAASESLLFTERYGDHLDGGVFLNSETVVPLEESRVIAIAW